MKIEEIKFEPTDKVIVIIGLAASGKTTITDKLSDILPDHDVIHSDDYMRFGFEKSLYRMIDDIKAKDDAPMIIEGVQCFRLLRKGVEKLDFFPDVVINTTCDTATRNKRYLERGGTSDLAVFDKTLYKFWMDYRDGISALPKSFKRPRTFNVETD